MTKFVALATAARIEGNVFHCLVIVTKWRTTTMMQQLATQKRLNNKSSDRQPKTRRGRNTAKMQCVFLVNSCLFLALRKPETRQTKQ